jgi:hypothetical protein
MAKRAISKKMLFSIIFLLIIVAALSTLYFAETQNKTQESTSTRTSNPITSPTYIQTGNAARIVSISPRDHWGNPVGMTLDFWFNVSIRNDGAHAIEGLTLNITVAGTSTENYDSGTLYEPIGTIQPGETADVQAYIIAFHDAYSNFNQFAGHNAFIQLISGDKILDETNMILPNSLP